VKGPVFYFLKEKAVCPQMNANKIKSIFGCNAPQAHEPKNLRFLRSFADKLLLTLPLFFKPSAPTWLLALKNTKHRNTGDIT